MRNRKQENWDEACEALGCAPASAPLEPFREATRTLQEMNATLERIVKRRREMVDRLSKRLEEEE